MPNGVSGDAFGSGVDCGFGLLLSSGLLSYRGGMGDRCTGGTSGGEAAAANSGVASVIGLSDTRGVDVTSGPLMKPEPPSFRFTNGRGRDVRVLASRAAWISAGDAMG